ncbi:hypothetical protein ELI20_37225 [Rhizobium ruizarguesonis]|uniref:hypothetical protein n=1 Tax=Rhizobium ruizarguesonis TaxID=2081791 RepID=UPI00103235D1|nr:hypothetical protein [Rhizobium ruizarguesonis]TAW03850.1 hypothetical protein ELI20_37225 [Rhizobium ruizarguesonis]
MTIPSKNSVLFRMPMIIVALVYAALYWFAPAQILEVLQIAWLDGRTTAWVLFLAPACIFALAHLALLSGKQPLHPVADTIIAALPLGALAGLIGRAVPDTLWLPAIALIVGVASAWASIRVLSVLRVRRAPAGRQAVSAYRAAFLVIIFWAILSGLLLWSPITVATMLGLGTVTIGLGLWGAMLGILLLWPRIGVAYLALCFAAALFGGNTHPVPQTTPNASSSGFEHKDAFLRWLLARGDLDQYRKSNRPYPVILASAEGGGIYAAAHSYLTLSAMATSCPNFPQHLFATVGISGGSIGSLLYAASPASQGTNEALKSCAPRTAPIDTAPLTNDLLSPVLANLLILQSLDFLMPFWQVAPDGGEILARALEKFNPDWHFLTTPLGETWTPTGTKPAQVYVSTDMGNGNRFVLSSVAGLGSDTAESYPGVAATDIAADRAAFISARFPWLTSTARLQIGDGNYRILADGGYFENSGADTVIDIVQQLKAIAVYSQDCAKSEGATDFSVVDLCKCPLYVDDIFTGHEQTVWQGCSMHIFIAYLPIQDFRPQVFNDNPTEKTDPRQNYLLDPISTMLNTRLTRGTSALTRARRIVSGLEDPDNVTGLSADGGYFPHFTAVSDLQLPLGWRMSPAKIEQMLKITAPIDACERLPGKAEDWRKAEEYLKKSMDDEDPTETLTSNAPEQGAQDIAPGPSEDETSDDSEIAFLATENGCNMAALAWLFNPSGDRNAYAIPYWD